MTRQPRADQRAREQPQPGSPVLRDCTITHGFAAAEFVTAMATMASGRPLGSGEAVLPLSSQWPASSAVVVSAAGASVTGSSGGARFGAEPLTRAVKVSSGARHARPLSRGCRPSCAARRWHRLLADGQRPGRIDGGSQGRQLKNRSSAACGNRFHRLQPAHR